jgi:hypothetical protein
MRINLQMIVLFSVAVISYVLGISVLQDVLRSPVTRAGATIMFAGCMFLLAFTFWIGISSLGENQFWEALSLVVCTLVPVARSNSTLPFSEQQVQDMILVPIRRGAFELRGQNGVPCIELATKQLQKGRIGVEAKASFGPSFHVTSLRGGILLK